MSHEDERHASAALEPGVFHRHSSLVIDCGEPSRCGPKCADPNNVAPPAATANEDPATQLDDWRKQMVDRITRNTTFPARGQCREGLVKISFLIDRAGNLVASEIAESSNIPAFDAEALAIIKRGHPFPPPPKGVGGPRVTLTVPVRFRQPSQDVSGERRFYLNLKADLTLTLNGTPVQRTGLDRAISSTTNNDKSAQIMICSDENVPAGELSSLVAQVKGAGFKYTIVPRPDPTSD
jgi:TonB family protein